MDQSTRPQQAAFDFDTAPAPIGLPTWLCQHCGHPFQRRNHASQPPLYCSSRCAALHRSPESRLRGRSETRQCGECGKDFTAWITLPRRYCSEACGYAARRKRHTPTLFTCVVCGLLFTSRSQGKTAKYCSPACQKAAHPPLLCSIPDCGKRALARGWCGQHYQRWSIMGDAAAALPESPGGRHYQSGGYVYLVLPGTRRRILEHRYVMEQKLGRSLLRSEAVHHRNGVKDDNRLDNLELLSRGAHCAMHNRKNRRFAWSRDFPACIECGTTTRPHSTRGRCGTCYSRIFYRLKHPLTSEQSL